MKRLNVELEDGDYLFLKGRAAKEGRSVVAVIREAIERFRKETIDVRSDPMYAVGSFDGPADLAERHDDYLYG